MKKQIRVTLKTLITLNKSLSPIDLKNKAILRSSQYKKILVNKEDFDRINKINLQNIKTEEDWMDNMANQHAFKN